MRRLRESGERRPQTPVEVETTILRLGLRLATEFASRVDVRPRVAFFRVNEDTVIPVIELSGGNRVRSLSFPLGEHPTFAEIVATGKPRANGVASRPLGPKVREIAARTGVSARAGVPITREGSLLGILAIGLQAPEVPDELFRRLIDLGRLLEFALATSLSRGAEHATLIDKQSSLDRNSRGALSGSKITSRSRRTRAVVAE
jgi:GAF domain-containing protein